MFPVTTVDKHVDTPAPPHAFRNHEDEAVYKMCEFLPSFPPFRPQPWNTLPWYLHRRLIETSIPCTPDDPELFHGLPVGLQLIGRTQEEEGVTAMTEVVVEALEASKRK